MGRHSAAIAAATFLGACSALAPEPRAIPEPVQQPVTEYERADAQTPSPVHTAPPPDYGNRVVRRRQSDGGAE